LDDADRVKNALARLVVGWLREAPAARFLVAARGRVAVPAAQRFELGPLEVPAAGDRDKATIERAPAVALFLRCAVAVRPDYRLGAESARHVAEIVRTLDGLPLAIELCAPRVVALGEAEIAALLAERLDALEGGSAAKDGPSLRGAFDLSWDLLEAGDARVLAACSVFRGSFDLEAAAAVTGEARLPTAEALERLDDASLIRAFDLPELPGARRHRMPASVRLFAADRLTSPEKAARRHAELFGRTRAPTSTNADLLALDREDLEAALTWATERGPRTLAAGVALALAPLALARGPLVPFLERVDALLDGGELPRGQAAELHLARGMARIHHGRRDDALTDLALARRLAARTGDLRTEILAASKTGLIVGLKGRTEEARTHFAAARAQLDGRSDPWLCGIVAKDHGNVLSEAGLDDEAMIELARARDLFHRAGDVREEGFVLMMLGSRLFDSGRLRDARRDCTRALEKLRLAGDHRSAGWCEVLLALIDAESGDLSGARARLDGALAVFRVVGDVHTEGIVLGYLGNVALEQGALDDAETSYRDARVRLAEVGDRGSEAMATAGAAVVDVALGRTAPARARFAEAVDLLRGDGRAARREAVDLLATVLEPRAPEKRSQAAAEEVRSARRIVATMRARVTVPKKKRAREPSPRTLVVAPDGSWLRAPDGSAARFAKGALRAIVHRLVQERVRYPGRVITPASLVHAGWPGESMLAGAAKNRLHVTIARLRRAGLAGVLVRVDDGYVLDEAVPTRFAEDGERP
ncbi:MAG TPA: hypothetical protein VLT33_36155, partial [Labilithrix sp.]|nr:hypothetical protein [Labilithrix sp.]